MDFITWATSPWGQSVPIHIAWYLIWVMVIAGLLFMIVHALYVGIFAPKKTFAKNDSPAVVAVYKSLDVPSPQSTLIAYGAVPPLTIIGQVKSVFGSAPRRA